MESSMRKTSVTEKKISAAQSQALAIASQAQTSSTMHASAMHQEAAEVSLSARALVRQNTFTKDSLEVSPEATARPVSTEGSQARLVSQAWNSEEGQVGFFRQRQRQKI